MEFVKVNFGVVYNIYGREVLRLDNIKERLAKLGMTQVELLRKLREQGTDVQPPQLSNIINGNYTYPKARKVLSLCDDLLTEVENNAT